jgi:hypothetical protein
VLTRNQLQKGTECGDCGHTRVDHKVINGNRIVSRYPLTG